MTETFDRIRHGLYEAVRIACGEEDPVQLYVPAGASSTKHLTPARLAWITRIADAKGPLPWGEERASGFRFGHRAALACRRLGWTEATWKGADGRLRGWTSIQEAPEGGAPMVYTGEVLTDVGWAVLKAAERTAQAPAGGSP